MWMGFWVFDGALEVMVFMVTLTSYLRLWRAESGRNSTFFSVSLVIPILSSMCSTSLTTSVSGASSSRVLSRRSFTWCELWIIYYFCSFVLVIFSRREMSFLYSSSSHLLKLTNTVDWMFFSGTSSVRQNVKKGSPRKIWNELAWPGRSSWFTGRRRSH